VVLASTGRISVPEARCFYRKFHSRFNLSTCARNPRHRGSALEAACLKAGYLLHHAPHDLIVHRAVSRLLTQQIIDAYPDPIHRRGLAFLRQHGIPLSPEFDASPWFLQVRPLIGWKTTRRLQDGARICRRLVQIKNLGASGKV
jgi:hypothetical protein